MNDPKNENPDCPLCDTIMVWCDLTIDGRQSDPRGSETERILICMKEDCLLAGDATQSRMWVEV